MIPLKIIARFFIGCSLILFTIIKTSHVLLVDGLFNIKNIYFGTKPLVFG